MTNCLCFRKLGIAHSLENLIDQADLFILDHFEDIIKQSRFFDFDLDGLNKLCGSDDLNVSVSRAWFDNTKMMDKSSKTGSTKIFRLLVFSFCWPEI